VKVKEQDEMGLLVDIGLPFLLSQDPFEAKNTKESNDEDEDLPILL